MLKKLAYKLLGNKYSLLAKEYNQIKTLSYSVLHPYKYNQMRYSGTFLTNNAEIADRDYSNENINRVIFVFWTGDNEITPNRLAGIKSLENCSEIAVKLITPQNLNDYIKDDDPLPEAYQFLSFVHKADYLRTYFMYHYGGGYADIKNYFASWKNAFDKLEQSDSYVIGYREVGFWGVANNGIENKNLKKDLKNHWRLLIGNGAYICRPYTKFTTEWYMETKRRIISYTEQLRLHPAKDAFGTNIDYPIPWSNILGEVFHPLCLKYNDKLLFDNALKPSFENYR